MDTAFTTSSFCMTTGCVEVKFETSSFCHVSGCVEVALVHGPGTPSGAVIVRDTKGNQCFYTQDEWKAFIAGVKNGEFEVDVKLDAAEAIDTMIKVAAEAQELHDKLVETGAGVEPA